MHEAHRESLGDDLHRGNTEVSFGTDEREGSYVSSCEESLAGGKNALGCRPHLLEI